MTRSRVKHVYADYKSRGGLFIRIAGVRRAEMMIGRAREGAEGSKNRVWETGSDGTCGQPMACAEKASARQGHAGVMSMGVPYRASRT